MMNESDRLTTKTTPNGRGWTTRSTRGRAGGARRRAETDVGTTDDETDLATDTDKEYGYSPIRPADWSIESDGGGGTTFEDGASVADVILLGDENRENDLTLYTERFHEELAADDQVHNIKRLNCRSIRLTDGHQGRGVGCAYVSGAPDECWRLIYLFVVAGTTRYTIGVDRAADADFGRVARTVVESFALTANSTERSTVTPKCMIENRYATTNEPNGQPSRSASGTGGQP
jgi:hypothetical protein